MSTLSPFMNTRSVFDDSPLHLVSDSLALQWMMVITFDSPSFAGVTWMMFLWVIPFVGSLYMNGSLGFSDLFMLDIGSRWGGGY